MRYAILYSSATGNTEYLAEKLYDYLSEYDIKLCNIDKCSEIPTADFYFVGFGIHNGNCSMAVVDAMEQISGAPYALFVTCGFIPTESYKEMLCQKLSVWAPDDSEFVDMFLSQGKVAEEAQKMMYEKHPDIETMLEEMFEKGEEHPNEEDINNLTTFAQHIIENW